MKIGIVSNLYPPDARGGAELVASRIANALYQRGHQVFVLTTKPFNGVKSFFPRVSERTLGSVYKFYPLNLYFLRQDGTIPFPLRMIWHMVDLCGFSARWVMRSVIQKEEPDIIITHNLKGLGVSVAREIQNQGVTHIHTLHDVQLSIPSGLLIYGQEQSWLNKSFMRRVYERCVRRVISTPDLVLSPSQFLADFYKKRGIFQHTRVEILPNPLPPDEIDPRGKRIATKTRFLFVGQLEEHKGLRTLMAAMAKMGEEVELHIAGEGALNETVIEWAQRDARIFFHGFVSLNHLVRLLQQSDAVLVPSTCYENSPTVIYESYLVGVPVIASRIGGISELVKEGETGLLVEPGNEEELTEAMNQIHTQRDEWWNKTKFIRSQAECYSIDHYVDRLEKFMKELLDKEKNTD